MTKFHANQTLFLSWLLFYNHDTDFKCTFKKSQTGDPIGLPHQCLHALPQNGLTFRDDSTPVFEFIASRDDKVIQVKVLAQSWYTVLC